MGFRIIDKSSERFALNFSDNIVMTAPRNARFNHAERFPSAALWGPPAITLGLILSGVASLGSIALTAVASIISINALTQYLLSIGSGVDFFTPLHFL